jgi:hypothetical protein
MSSILDRRTFLQVSSAYAALLTQGYQQVKPAQRAGRGAVKNRENFVGIQVRGFAWVDEGVDQVLDNLQEKGGVNTVFAYTFAYGEQRSRKDSAIPLPDHGIAGNSDVAVGAFYDYDPKYFQNTILKDFRSPAYGKFDVIKEVAPKAKARGMDFFAWDLNNPGTELVRQIPNYSEVTEVDLYGRRTANACFNNPDYRAFLNGMIESLLLGYSSEVDGIAWGSERTGPLENIIGGGGIVTCFCQFCQAKARERGISADRARAGYVEIQQLFQAAAQDQRPADGYFVTFWRTLLKYPEVLAWEALWTDSLQEVQAEVYGIAKGIAYEKPFGFHILQAMTLSPFNRAEQDYAKFKNFADFLKPATYNNAGGPRLAAYLKRLSATIFHDATPDDFVQFYYKIMGYQEAPFEQLAATGLSADWVARETKRALQDVAGEAKIYPGIDIDVPPLGAADVAAEKHTKPDDVKNSLRAAFGAGADGVVLSREYAEMWLANLSAAGDTLKEIFAQAKT